MVTPALVAFATLKAAPAAAVILLGIWGRPRPLPLAARAAVMAAYCVLFGLACFVYVPRFYMEDTVFAGLLTGLLAWALFDRRPGHALYVGLLAAICVLAVQACLVALLQMASEASVGPALRSLTPESLLLEPLAAALCLPATGFLHGRLARQDALPAAQGLLSVVVPYLVYLCLAVWSMPGIDAGYAETPAGRAGVAVVVLAALLASVVAPLVLAENVRLKAELDGMEALASTRYRATMERRADDEETRRVLHDIRNQLACIAATEDAQVRDHHLRDVEEQLRGLGAPRYTGLETLDVVLGQKRAAAGAAGIDYHVQPLALSEPFLSSVDMCSVFGNALDNAIEACGRMDPGAYRFVEVRFRRQGSLLAVSIANSCPAPAPGRGPATGAVTPLPSSKRPGGATGFGLKSIARCLERCGASSSIKMDAEAGVFTLTMLFPLSGRAGACDGEARGA